MTDQAADARYAPAVADALAAFPIAVRAAELVHVSENLTWRVTDDVGRRYVLRLHRPGYHTLEELVSERVWIRSLDAAGIAVPQGIRTRTGEEYATVTLPETGERRHAGLAHWTEGEVLERVLAERAGSLADPALIGRWFGQLGALIAAMHNQASGWPAPPGFERHALDADGLMGQIVEVSAGTSRALLITDATHSIPVQVNRNGVRAIAEGTGSLGELEVRHVSANTDIETGDLLVTSGLGGRFPGGYPVAVVTAIERDPGRMFARVVARPNAALDRSRHVLLVFAPESTKAAAATGEAAAADSTATAVDP